MFRKTIVTVLTISTLTAAALASASASGSGFPRNGMANDRFVAHKETSRRAVKNPGSRACTPRRRHFHWYSGYVDSCPKW